MTVSHEGFLDFFKKNHKVLIDTDNEKVSLAESGSDDIFIVYKYDPNGVFKDLYYKTTAGNLNPVERSNIVARFLNDNDDDVDVMLELVTRNTSFLNNLTSKLKSNIKAPGSGTVKEEFDKLFRNNERYDKFEYGVRSLDLDHFIKVLNSDTKHAKKYITPRIKPFLIEAYERQIKLLKLNYPNITSNLSLVNSEWFKYLSEIDMLGDAGFVKNLNIINRIIEVIQSLISGEDVKSYLNVSKVTTESFSESTSYLESLGLSLGVENIDVGINETTDEYDEDIIVENQGPIEEITILQDNLTSATEAQIVLESLVSKLEDGLDNQSKPFVAITLQQFKEYGSVEVISTETAKQLLSNVGRTIVKWLREMWRRIVDLSRYIKTKIFNVFDRIRNLFARHKSTPVPKDFAAKNRPADKLMIKNLNMLIDNKSNNQVHSDSSGYTSFKALSDNLKILMDTSIDYCNASLAKVKPLLANFDDIENGGTFKPQDLNDEKALKFGCLKLKTTVNDSGHVIIRLDSELSPEDQQAEVAVYPATANDIVPFDINTYKNKFSQILEEVLKLENDKRIRDAILHFDNIGDLTSTKSIYLKNVTTTCLSISTLIIEVSKIVNTYRVYLEKSNEQRTAIAA